MQIVKAHRIIAIVEKFRGLIPITEITALPDQGGTRQPQEQILLTVPFSVPHREITDTASPLTHGGNSTANRDRKALMILKEFPATESPHFG